MPGQFDRFSYSAMAGTTSALPPMPVAESQLDGISARFNALRVDEQATVLGSDTLRRFSNPTKEVYKYLTAMCDKGKNEMSVPAMLVPAMLGMSYKARDSQKDFVRNFLKEHGDEGVDWTFKAKTSVFSNGGLDSAIEFPVPGDTTGEIVFRRDCGPATKFPYVTPHFARILMLRSTTTVGRELADFYLAVHDELLSFLRGGPSVLAPVIESAQLKRAREMTDVGRAELELTTMRAESKRIKMESLADSLATMERLFGLDDRDQIYFKDVMRTVVADNPATTSGAITDTPTHGRGQEISIAMVLHEMGINPRGQSPNIGKEMAKRWRNAHPGETIPKRQVLYNGRPYNENTYYEADKALMKASITHVIDNTK